VLIALKAKFVLALPCHVFGLPATGVVTIVAGNGRPEGSSVRGRLRRGHGLGQSCGAAAVSRRAVAPFGLRGPLGGAEDGPRSDGWRLLMGGLRCYRSASFQRSQSRRASVLKAGDVKRGPRKFRSAAFFVAAEIQFFVTRQRNNVSGC